MRQGISFLVSVILFCASSLKAADVTVTVRNQSNNPIPGAIVYAVSQMPGGFNPGATKVGVTDVNGMFYFSTASGTALTDTNFYDFFASSQGYAPSLIGQRNTGHPGFTVQSSNNPPVFIGLSTNNVSNVGQINVTVTNATAAVISAAVRYNTGYSQPIALGFVATTNNSGVIQILNVPAAAANTYSIEAFDPTPPGAKLNNSFGGTVVAGAASSFGPMDLNEAIPPVTSISPIQTSGPATDADVDGFMTSTNSVSIAWIGVSFNYLDYDNYGCPQGCPRNIWAHTDSNGRFQLYGLRSGTTYYASVQGGCSWNQNTQSSNCYLGFNSTAVVNGQYGTVIDTGAAPGGNDILFQGTQITKKIKLQAATGGSGRMAVYVKGKDASGNPMAMPWSGVSLWPDWSQWDICGGSTCPAPGPSTCTVQNQAFSSFNGQATTGYALVTGLLPGNYQLSIWTGFSQGGQGTSFNTGTSTYTPHSYGWNQCGNGTAETGPWRLAISTADPVSGAATGGNDVYIYDTYGNLLSSGTPSVTVPIAISTSGLSALIQGSISFTGTSGNTVDLSQQPITLTLQPRCTNECHGGGNFIVFQSSIQPLSSSYSVNVASGQTYWFNVNSQYWGQVRDGGGNNQVSLTSTGTAIINLKFAPAGRWLGKVYTPKGVYTPSQNSWANINANGENSWGWSQINPDGTFVVGGLLPGTYRAGFNASGSSAGEQAYTQQPPLPTITVAANQDVSRDVSLVNGVNVLVQVSTSSLPPLPSYVCPPDVDHDCPPERWTVRRLAAGSPMGNDELRKFMNITAGGDEQAFEYHASTIQSGGACHDQIYQPGFCPNTLPDQAAYDLYLLRSGGFDEAGIADPPTRPYFVVYASSKSVLIDDTNQAAKIGLFRPNQGGPQGSTISVQAVPIGVPNLTAVPQATLSGSFTAQNMIRQQDFVTFGGDFEKFLAYIPIVTLYNSTGSIVAGGAAVPLPTCLETTAIIGGVTDTLNNHLDRAVMGNNWTMFQSLMTAGCFGQFGYEIRGLTAGRTYGMVVTTLNYPPYKTSVTLNSAAGSTTTVNVNLDALVGSGASIAGVITDTATVGVPISNAAVKIQSEGYEARTVTTGSTGTYRLDGLPNGAFRIRVTAPGRALRTARVNVTAAQTYTQNIALPLGPGSITGQVTDAVSFEPLSATIYAYNDTLNVQSSGTAQLSLYQAQTSSTGTYIISGLEAGAVYKLFAKATGYKIATSSITATVGVSSGTSTNFNLTPKPFNIEVFGAPNPANPSFYRFTVLNPGQFLDGNAWIGPSPFSFAGSTEVGNLFQERTLSDGAKQLILDYPIADLGSTMHVMHTSATYIDLNGFPNFTTKDVTFSSSTPGSSQQEIADQIIGDDSLNAQGLPSNAILFDPNGVNASAITLPTGSVSPITGDAIPELSLSGMSPYDASVSTIVAATGDSGGAGAFVSDLYTATLSSITYNTGINVTLAYDQNNSDYSDMAIYTYVNGAWTIVPGVQTINPLNGTISITGIASLASVLGLPKGHPMKSLSDGKSFQPNSAAITAARVRLQALDDTGVFAVLKPSLVVSTGSYLGTTIKIFNFPNPFNLSMKTVQPTGDGTGSSSYAAQTINGTMIKIELPAGVSGEGVIRIYTTSGELVRELHLGNLTGGQYIYTPWDGKNKSGSSVANGVYYGVLSVPGVKVKDARFKLAVIK